MYVEDLDPSWSPMGFSCKSHVKGQVPGRENTLLRIFLRG